MFKRWMVGRMVGKRKKEVKKKKEKKLIFYFRGPKSIEFENKVSSYFGKKYGVFVNSGSSACLLAVAACKLPPGSEIVTPACTFSTTVAPIMQLGFTPVFVDVERTSYVPSVDSVINAITDKTRAIMLPNLIGNLPDWEGIRKRLPRKDILLIEDR